MATLLRSSSRSNPPERPSPASASAGRTTAQDGVVIGYDGESVWVGGIEIPYVLSEGQDALKLRVFLDKSVIEVFVDDGTRVASNFIDCGANDLGIELFARGGAAAFRSIDIWEMESIR